MPYSSAALEDESLPPPEASPAGPSGSRSVTVPDSDAPVSDKNDPGPAPFHQHPRPEGFHIFPQEKGLPPTPPIDEPRSTGVWQRQPAPYYEPYIPSEGRDHGQWGEPSGPGERLPQPRDLPQLIHNVVMGLGRWGSHYSGMPAIAMGTYANAYWQAYQKGMKERASDNWQKYRQARQMTLDRTKEEIQAAREGYALYGKDPEKLKQYMQQLATRYQDQSLANAIAISPAATYELWKTKDRYYHDLEKDAARENKGNELPEAWGGKPKGSTSTEPPTGPPTSGAAPSGSPLSPSNTEPDTDTEPDTPDESGDGDTAPAREAEPTTSGQAPATAPTRGGAPAAGEPPAINPLVKQAADELARTGKMPADVPKGAQQLVQTEAARQNAALNGMMNDGTITGKDENRDLGAIRRVNPSLARDVEAMGHGRRLVPSGGAGMYANMENIVRKVYPDWDAGLYDYIKEFKKGPESKIYESIGTLKKAAEGVLRELQNLDENASPPRNWIDKETGVVSAEASAKWGALANALFQYVEESIAIQNGGRRPLASQTAREILAFPTTRGAKTIRALLTTSAIADVGRIDAANHTWYSNTHLKEPPPGYDPDSAGWARALADMDYNTGYMRNPGTPVPKDMEPYLGPAGKNLHKGSQSKEPTVGEIRYGYKFKGGNWRDRNNWEKQ